MRMEKFYSKIGLLKCELAKIGTFYRRTTNEKM